MKKERIVKRREKREQCAESEDEERERKTKSRKE